jgi:hypothetical protein
MKIKPDRMIQLLNGKDRIVTRPEALKLLNVPVPSTFWKRRYPALIRRPRLTRYSYHDIMNYHIERWVRD